MNPIPLVKEVVTLLRQCGSQHTSQLTSHLEGRATWEVQVALHAASRMHLIRHLGGHVYEFEPRSTLLLAEPPRRQRKGLLAVSPMLLRAWSRCRRAMTPRAAA